MELLFGAGYCHFGFIQCKYFSRSFKVIFPKIKQIRGFQGHPFKFEVIRGFRGFRGPVATLIYNCYNDQARLFIIGGKEISSREGTTQGDPTVMGTYE